MLHLLSTFLNKVSVARTYSDLVKNSFICSSNHSFSHSTKYIVSNY